MKYILIFSFFILSANANGQMLQAVKSTIDSHLSDNKGKTNYIGGLNIIDATLESDGKTITVKGTFTHKGFWTNVEKPFVAKVKVVLDEFVVERLCYYKYLSAYDEWNLICTNGKSTISPKPAFPSKY